MHVYRPPWLSLQCNVYICRSKFRKSVNTSSFNETLYLYIAIVPRRCMRTPFPSARPGTCSAQGHARDHESRSSASLRGNVSGRSPSSLHADLHQCIIASGRSGEESRLLGSKILFTVWPWQEAVGASDSSIAGVGCVFINYMCGHPPPSPHFPPARKVAVSDSAQSAVT